MERKMYFVREREIDRERDKQRERDRENKINIVIKY